MSQITQAVLILSKSRWAFEDEKTGEVRMGTTLNYIVDLDTPERGNNFEGVKVGKLTFDKDKYADMGVVPGWYLIGFNMGIVQGKPALKPVSCDFIEPLKPVVKAK